MERVAVIVEKASGYEGLIIPSKNNPDNGAIMLRSRSEGLNDSGFLTIVNKVGLFKGRVADLQRLIDKYGLTEGSDFNEVMPVRLVIQESTTKAWEGQEEKIYPENSDRAGEVITHGGSPVYRQTLVVPENSQLVDTVLPMDREPATNEATASNVFQSQDQRTGQ